MSATNDKQQVVELIEKSSSDRTNPNREQSAVIYDLVSEGEIYGLNDGLSSIFLNGTPLIDSGNWNVYKPKRSKNGITCTGGNTTITVPNDFSSTYHSTDDGQRYIRIQKGLASLAGNNSSTGATTDAAGKVGVTTSSNFFTSAMLSDSNISNGLYPRIRIAGAGPAGTEYVGKLKKLVSATSGEVEPPITTDVSHKTITCDYVGKVTAYNSSTTLTVETAPAVSVSGGGGQISTPYIQQETLNDFLNFKNVQVNVRTGTKNQHALPRPINNVPSAAFAITPSEALKQSNHWSSLSNIPSNYNDTELTSDYDPSEGQANDTIITATGTGSKAFGLANPQDIDNLKVTLKFPGGMFAQKIQTDSAGEKAEAHAEFQMFFEFSRDDGSSYTSIQVVGPTDDQINTRGHTDALLLQNTGMEKTHHAWGPVNFNCVGYKTPNNGYIVTYSKSAFFEEFYIPIERYKPFDNWRLRVKKVTADNPLAQSNDWQYQNDTILYAVEAQVNDWLNYPDSAIISLAMNATDFTSTSLPTRQYEIKGIKCQVPTNYHPRQELTTTSQPSYTRNISSGADAGSYQNWDGNLRGDTSTFDYDSVNYKKVWTDNPAWIFYDLCTNKRYGLGNHIDSDDIDKYELYQIAQYCDELVPNGKGGTEPRFTANIYLSNSQQAYKVLKDFASVFRGMLFWHNGKLTASSDREKDPVYTFNKANVIEGMFSYTGSSKKLRTNQVRVTWNDPDLMYRQNVEIVEDTQNIVDMNKLVTKNVVAYGCTSQGQAKRYGKWHLLSEKLQKEIVSFTTGLNGGFLRPGDVIEVNDADRHRVQFSGRVSGTGTRNTTTIPLDRSITLASGKTYELTLIYPEAGVYLVDNSDASYSGQTFGGHANALDTLSGGSGYTNGSYTNIPTTGGTGQDLTVDVTVTSNAVSSISINNKGYGYTDNDDITVTNFGAFTTSGTKATFKVNGLASNTTGVKNGDLLTFVKTQEGASNLRNTSNAHVHAYFSEHSRVEKQTVSTGAGSVSSLTVDSAFTDTPNAEVIWALIVASSTSGDLEETGSAKKYQITSVAEDNKDPHFKISALEYADHKFNEVDRGWKTAVPEFTRPVPGAFVPAPTALVVSIATKTNQSISSSTTTKVHDTSVSVEALVSWSPPTNQETDEDDNTINTVYQHFDHYEIEHSFRNNRTQAGHGRTVFERETILAEHFEFPDMVPGAYKVRVRTVNTVGNYSKWVSITGSTGVNLATHPASRIYQVPMGGTLSNALTISSSTVSIGAGASQTYDYTTPTGKTLAVSSASAAKGTQDFNGMGASAEAYLLLDYSVPDLKAIELKTDTTSTSPTSGVKTRFSYWAEVGASNNGLTAASGTVSITAGSPTLTGSSTNFDGDFTVGDFIKVGSGASYNATSDYFRVAAIVSDTSMILDAVSPRTYSGATAARQSFIPDLQLDGIIAKVTTDGSTNYTLDPLAEFKSTAVSMTAGVTGTLPPSSGGTGTTDFADSTHKNENVTVGDVGLSGGTVIPTVFRQASAPTALAVGDLWVDTDDGNKLYRASATGSSNWVQVNVTSAGIGLGNVPNVDMRDIGNVTSGTLATGRGGTGLTSVSTLLNSNVDAEHVGLENVPNVDMRDMGNANAGTLAAARGGTGLTSVSTLLNSNTTAANVGLDNVPNVDMRDIGNVTSGTLSAARGGTGLTSISSLQNSAISYASILSASPASSVQWITQDGASYSPTGTTQDITVTFDGGTSTATCTVRWTYVNVSSSNNDYISACAFTGSSTGFTLGNPSPDLSGNNVKFASCVVTHTASSTTITLSALLSLLNVSGGGK